MRSESFSLLEQVSKQAKSLASVGLQTTTQIQWLQRTQKIFSTSNSLQSFFSSFINKLHLEEMITWKQEGGKQNEKMNKRVE